MIKKTIKSKDGCLSVNKEIFSNLSFINASSDSWGLNTETLDRGKVAMTLNSFIKFIMVNELTEVQARSVITVYIDSLKAKQCASFYSVLEDYLHVIFHSGEDLYQ